MITVTYLHPWLLLNWLLFQNHHSLGWVPKSYLYENLKNRQKKKKFFFTKQITKCPSWCQPTVAKHWKHNS